MGAGLSISQLHEMNPELRFRVGVILRPDQQVCRLSHQNRNSLKAPSLRSGGITVVITNLAVMRFDDDTGQMYLDQYYPGVTPDNIVENMAFTVEVFRATEAIPPSGDELRILREKCDP